MIDPSTPLIDFVSQYMLPAGLIIIMFGLGLSVSVSDLTRIVKFPKAILLGVTAQILLMPTIGFALTLFFPVDPVLALSLIVIASCPGGVTSNILTFYGRADVALSILITATSSIITVFTAPAVISIALHQFPEGRPVNIPDLAGLTGNLFLFSTSPILAGMLCRVLLPSIAGRIMVFMRPASLGILLTVIGFSVLINLEFVRTRLLEVIPLALMLNLAAMGLGLAVAHNFKLNNQQSATITIELAVQNVTMATFLGISVLGSAELAAVPTIYGVLMVITALVFLNFWQRVRPIPD